MKRRLQKVFEDDFSDGAVRPQVGRWSHSLLHRLYHDRSLPSLAKLKKSPVAFRSNRSRDSVTVLVRGGRKSRHDPITFEFHAHYVEF